LTEVVGVSKSCTASNLREEGKIMPQTPFNFIAHFRARPGSEQALQDAIMACVTPTRAEPGNVNYDLHRSQDDPAVFVIYEGWKGRDALEEHFQTPHFKALMAAAEALVAERSSDSKPFTAESLVMISDIAGPAGN
jgi:quinol monooxygenase YgiN